MPSQAILEGIVTTLNEDASVNISPMGPRVDAGMDQFELRPFQTSKTYANLKRHGEGVLHVTDDVELLALAAIGRLGSLKQPPRSLPAKSVDGAILCDACRWYAFRVTDISDEASRTSILCRVVDRGRLRDFFGFNRAKHAVVEAAILSTRLEFLPRTEIEREFQRLEVIVAKTAGAQEERAFAMLKEFVASRLQ